MMKSGIEEVKPISNPFLTCELCGTRSQTTVHVESIPQPYRACKACVLVKLVDGSIVYLSRKEGIMIDGDYFWGYIDSDMIE